ncbi:MAG: hypothetical protein IE885_04885 [Campylobacterales bacterium]|nr:hypothetical protein [Campylobacterales bacterium]
MKKVVLSAAAVIGMAGVANASSSSELAELKAQMAAMAKKIEMLESKQAKSDQKVEKITVAKESEKNDITIVNPDSPEFLLGKETDINMKFKAQDDPDMWLKAGIRLQGTFDNRQTDYVDPTKADQTLQDAFMRRVRFEIAAGFTKNTSFVMDVRNDKANYEDKGEEGFNVGDAYVKIDKPFDDSLVNFKLYRAKIDVSRTETVKSAHTICYDRPYVADEAAQFISENRRAANAQMYGDWNKKVHYQLAFGDATASDHSKDAIGTSLNGSIKDANFFYGGKLILSPFDGWEETDRTETYFGEGKHFALGVGYWKAPNIEYSTGDSTDHTLINYELSAHYKNAFVQAEYFDFDGVVRKWASDETGTSSGWYATGEYVIPELSYIAPFVRYEKWDRWEDASGYDLTSKVAGINWYLRGNTTKVGLVYQKDSYGEEIGNKDVTSTRVTTQWFF